MFTVVMVEPSVPAPKFALCVRLGADQTVPSFCAPTPGQSELFRAAGWTVLEAPLEKPFRPAESLANPMFVIDGNALAFPPSAVLRVQQETHQTLRLSETRMAHSVKATTASGQKVQIKTPLH